MEQAACLLCGSMLTSQQLPSRAAVMRNYLPPSIRAYTAYYTLSIGKRKWKDRDRHPSSICSLNPTLTWIMSYVKSCHIAVPTVSAVGLNFQGAQTDDSVIIPL